MLDREKDVMKKTTKKQIERGVSLTKKLLMMLVKFPAGITEVFIMSDPNYRRYFYGREVSRRQVRRALDDLHKQRLVEKREYQGKTKYELTNIGRVKNLKWNYKRLPKKERRDGLTTIVVFDIPETKRRSRDFLRRFLKENAFIQLQKSVFIGRFRLNREFDELLNELGVGEYVTVIEGRVPNY